MKQKLLSMVLIICCVFSTFPHCALAKSARDDNTAYAVLGDGVESVNFSKVNAGTKEDPDKGERAGEKCWIMSNRLGGELLAYINFDLDKNFAENVNTGDVYEIEVDYWDQGNGYFYLEYDSHFKPMKQAEVTYLQNEEMWKTVKYTVDDAYFGNRVDGGYDFRLVIKPWQSTVYISPGPVAVKEVRVKKIPGVNKIFTTASTDESGNSFAWYSEEKTVHNTLKNLTDTVINADVTFTAIGASGYKEFEITEKMTFSPYEEKKKDINIDTQRCDLYDWIITVKSESSSIEQSRKTLKLAILKTDPDGIRNEHAYLSTHLERYVNDYPTVLDEGMDLISKSNVIGIRGTGSWPHMEVIPGKLEWDGVIDVVVGDKAREKGMQVLWQILAGNPSVTGLWSDLVRTDEEYEQYGRFLEFFVDHVKDYSTDYEIANELDLPQYNTRGLSTEELTKLIKFASSIIKERDPDAKVHAWGFTGIKGSGNWDMLNEAIKWGTLDALDYVSYHPYNNTDVVELNGLSDAASRYLEHIRSIKPEAGLSITEVGNSIKDSEVSYDMHNLGSNMTRMGVHFLSREVADVLVYYNFERKGVAPLGAREDGFGMVELPMTRASDDSGRAMIPFEAYVSFTAMNYLMAQTTADRIYDVDSNIKISSFDSQKFGGKVLAMNTVTTPQVVSLKLNCDSIRQFDDFGNENIVYGNDGIYTFCLDDRLLYAVGDFSSVEVVESAPLKLEKAQIEAVIGDVFNVNVKSEDDREYTYDIKAPINCEVVEASDIKSGNGFAKVQLNERRNDYMFIDVMLTDKQTGKLSLWGQIRVTIPTPITGELKVELIDEDDLNGWRSVFDVTNNSQSKAVRGYIKINSPEIFSAVQKLDIGIIPPGRTAQVQVDLPPLTRKGIYNIDYDVVTDVFESENFVESRDLTVAGSNNGKIKIDGILDDGEWDENSFMYADTQEQIGNITDWRGPNDISFKAAIAYDEEYMYLCADVTDDKFYQDQTGKTTWQGDSIQFGIFYGEEGHTALGERSTTFHEMCVAKTPNGPEIYRHLSQDNVYPSGEVEDAEIAVVRKDNSTCYEVKIPWEKLLLEGQRPKKGDKLGFAMLANDNDGSGRRGWMHYAGGIAPTKTTQLFTYLLLTK